MPRQRQPQNDQSSLGDALKGMAQQALRKNQGPGGRKKFKDETARTVAQGDITKRPFLPEESSSSFPVKETFETDPLRQSETPSKFRQKVKEMTTRLPFPSWMLDLNRSRVLTPGGEIRDESEFKGEDADLYNKEQRLNNLEFTSLHYQSRGIRSSEHPESCVCGKNGGCASRQSEKGTTKLPVGISKEEEENWITDEAVRREIPRQEMKDWYEEQKAPSAIRIPSTDHPGGHEPDESHYLLSQLDHDPLEECGHGGRNPFGHIVHIWNHDGAVEGLPKGLNIGMIVGYAPRSSSGKKSLSPEIIQQHRDLCGVGRDHVDGCPIKFHDDNCRRKKHAEGCTIPENTLTENAFEGETLYKVIPIVAKPPIKTEEQHNSKVDFEGLDAPKPEWQSTGKSGLQGGVSAPSSRCIHIPDAAATEFLTHGRVEGKRNPQNYFGSLNGMVGTRSALLTHNIYYPHPFSEEGATSLRSVPGIAYIMDQLKSSKPEDVQPVPEGFLPGKGPKKKKSAEESFLDFSQPTKPPTEASVRRSFTHVNENYQQTPSCRFCEDASYKDGKGAIVQTSTAPDGRPLYAHEECDNPFSFAERFRFDFGGPNIVDDDFITLGSHNWGMGNQPGARKVNRELGIVTPSKPADLVSEPFSHPGNRKQIGSMGLPEHEAAEGMSDEVDPMMQPQVSNLDGNGTAKPRR